MAKQGQRKAHYKQNRPQQLRGFYHVAVTRSFHAAAEQMSLGQPAISLQVQALEREMQAGLLKRKRGAVSLTLEGQVLFELAAPLVEALESLDEAFRERLGQYEVGEVKCAATDIVVMDVLPGLVREFRVRFPTIQVVLESCPSSQARDRLVRGDIEMAIGAVHQLPGTVLFQPLANYDSYLVVPHDHALAGRTELSLQELARYPLIAPLEGSQLWHDLQQALERRGVALQIATRLAGTEARLRYVASGLGITVVTTTGLPSDKTERFSWIPLAIHLPARTFGLMTRRNTYLSLPAKRFAEFILQAAPSFSPTRKRD